MTKSQAMTWYNRARSAAKSGKLDPQRVNRAFGLLQSNDGNARMQKYETTITGCTCPDHIKMHNPCKHMIARMMEVRAGQQQPVKSVKIVIAEIASAAPQRDFINAQYDSEILTNADKLFELAEQGYGPVGYELIRARRNGRSWVGTYRITFEK